MLTSGDGSVTWVWDLDGTESSSSADGTECTVDEEATLQDLTAGSHTVTRRDACCGELF